VAGYLHASTHFHELSVVKLSQERVKRQAMSAGVASRILALLLAATCAALLSCAKATESRSAVAGTTAAPAAERPEAKYDGFWRSDDSSLLIRHEGAGFIVSAKGPAGPKEVGTFENGVLKVGTDTALYSPSNDHLVIGGKEFERVDPRQQTIADLGNMKVGFEKYTVAYNGPPINEMDFFHGLSQYMSRFSLRDGWGPEYRYLHKYGQPQWAVVSAGPDGRFDANITAERIAYGYGGTLSDDIVMTNGQIDGVDHKF
jgi:hypothetical protein